MNISQRLFADQSLPFSLTLTPLFTVCPRQVIDGVAFAQRTSLKDCDTSMPFEPPKTSHGKIVYEPKLDRPETSTKQNDWAAVQCQTSVNWASGSWFWNHFSGGLNHQVRRTHCCCCSSFFQPLTPLLCSHVPIRSNTIYSPQSATQTTSTSKTL